MPFADPQTLLPTEKYSLGSNLDYGVAKLLARIQ